MARFVNEIMSDFSFFTYIKKRQTDYFHYLIPFVTGMSSIKIIMPIKPL